MKFPGKNKEQGQSLVEFAITLPVLILILSGLMDLGRAYYTFVALEEAVAEAALYLAISPDCPDYRAGVSDPKCEDPNNAIYRAEFASNAEFDISLARWNIPYDASVATAGFENPFYQNCNGIGCNVLVQVEYDFEVLTPGIQRFLDNTNNILVLRTQAAQIIVFQQQ